MPAEEPKFRNLYLNQRVAPVSALISRAEWFACAGEPMFEDGEAVYLALDMSTVVDLTALCMGRQSVVPKTRWWKTYSHPIGHVMRASSRRDCAEDSPSGEARTSTLPASEAAKVDPVAREKEVSNKISQGLAQAWDQG